MYLHNTPVPQGIIYPTGTRRRRRRRRRILFSCATSWNTPIRIYLAISYLAFRSESRSSSQTAAYFVLRPKPPSVTDADFWCGHASTMASNASWATRLASDVEAEAHKAKGKQLLLLQDTWELTQRQEIAKGFAGKPMTLVQLQTRYRSTAGVLTCRPLRRHGVKQGQKQAGGAPAFKPDGSPRMVDKIRLIDDSKRSSHNSTLIRCCETMAPPCRFTYMGYVADEVHRQAAMLGQTTPALVFSLDSDDMQVPSARAALAGGRGGGTLWGEKEGGRGESPRSGSHCRNVRWIILR